MSIPELETPRLRMRAWRNDHLDAYAPMCADPEVMKYIGTGAVQTREEAWRSMASFLGHWQLRGYGMWALERKPDGVLVGRAGFGNERSVKVALALGSVFAGETELMGGKSLVYEWRAP